MAFLVKTLLLAAGGESVAQEVKFEIQLYKVRDGEYCLDVQASNSFRG